MEERVFLILLSSAPKVLRLSGLIFFSDVNNEVRCPFFPRYLDLI